MSINHTDYFVEQLKHQPTKELYQTVFEVAKKQNYHNALEIGIAWAITTIAILMAGKGKLLSIDKSNYPNTQIQIDLYGFRDRWDFIEIPSEEALPKITGKYDLICIDGDHRYEWVRRDLDNAVRLLTDDGVIIVDDYNHKYNFDKSKDDYGVKQAVDEIVKEYGMKIKIYQKANGIAVLTKQR